MKPVNNSTDNTGQAQQATKTLNQQLNRGEKPDWYQPASISRECSIRQQGLSQEHRQLPEP
jgi:hypothetical protein